MDNFDDWGGQNGFDPMQSSDWDQERVMIDRPGSYGWHWLLTLVALVVVFLLSMGMAYLTRAVEERPVWMMGLIFMVPTAALMMAVMMVEKATSAMTPGTSRRPQMILAIIATIATFVVACICDLIYLQGFKKELAPAQSVMTSYEVSERLILIHDDTASMNENGIHDKEITILQGILQNTADQSEVGYISGTDQIIPQPLDDRNRESLMKAVQQKPEKGRLYYADLLEDALKMTEQAGINCRTRIVFLTDGGHVWTTAEEKNILERCLKDQVSIYCVMFGTEANETLIKYITETGGMVLQPDQAVSVIHGINHLRYDEQVAPAEIQDDIRLQQDLIRNRDISAIIITCIMLTLEGLSLGICLSLMMSVKGQFRIQYFISPLMGILAFFLLKMLWSQENMAATWWIKEGLSFSLLGIVLMMKNRGRGASRGFSQINQDMGSDFDTGFGTDSF